LIVPDESSGERLAELRAQLDHIDRRLLTAARERNEVVQRIALAKVDAGGEPLFDRARERAVYERAERIAREIDLSPAVARALLEVVVEASHHTQEQASRAAANGAARRIVIVGGKGRMGHRLGTEFTMRGHTVDVIDVDDDRDPGAVVAGADVVMIAVPMNDAVEVARRYAPLVRPDALMCDINSLKAEICAVMEAGCRGEVLGLHPMFGPTVHSLRRQKVVVCPGREGPLSHWLRGELVGIGVELVESNPEAHDRMMAVVQVLVHFSTIVMGEALRRCGVSVEDSLRFTSPIYRLELAFVGRLFAQNPDLYADIVATNPHSAGVREHFSEAVAAVEEAIRSDDRDRFRAIFAETASWFHGFGDEAMQLSDRIIDFMVRHP
jgi:chorismate mutase/prephenate dehydrogenase